MTTLEAAFQNFNAAIGAACAEKFNAAFRAQCTKAAEPLFNHLREVSAESVRPLFEFPVEPMRPTLLFLDEPVRQKARLPFGFHPTG